MIEVEWWEYDDAAEMAEAVAGDAQFLIESALDARGDAVVALPGGKTPLMALDLLKAAKLKWKSVTILPTDDRLVPVSDAQSNVRMLAERFLPLGARVLPLTGGDLPAAEAGKAADARLQAIHWPLDLVWLGVGADGHAASIFPGADLETALTAPHRAVGVTPDPLPAEALFRLPRDEVQIAPATVRRAFDDPGRDGFDGRVEVHVRGTSGCRSPAWNPPAPGRSGSSSPRPPSAPFPAPCACCCR